MGSPLCDWKDTGEWGKKKIKPFLNKDKGKAFPQKVGHSFFNANSELQKVAFSCNINFTLHILEQDI